MCMDISSKMTDYNLLEMVISMFAVLIHISSVQSCPYFYTIFGKCVTQYKILFDWTTSSLAINQIDCQAVCIYIDIHNAHVGVENNSIN